MLSCFTNWTDDVTQSCVSVSSVRVVASSLSSGDRGDVEKKIFALTVGMSQYVHQTTDVVRLDSDLFSGTIGVDDRRVYWRGS